MYWIFTLHNTGTNSGMSAVVVWKNFPQGGPKDTQTYSRMHPRACLRKIPREASDLSQVKSEYPRDHPREIFSRHPLRTFHCLSDFIRDATNWTSSRACDEFVSTCAPPAVLHMRETVHARPAVLCMRSAAQCCTAARRGMKSTISCTTANQSQYYSVTLEKLHYSYPEL